MLSTSAARCSSSVSSMFSGRICVTAKRPCVRVPVLSKTTISAFESASRLLLPFIRMPQRLAPPMPPKKLRGTEMTSAQGQLTTRKLSARYPQSPQSPPLMMDGTRKRSSAAAQTAGVYTRAKRVIKLSTFAFLSLAFSTMSRIFATVESVYSLVARTRRRPVWLMQPLIT